MPPAQRRRPGQGAGRGASWGVLWAPDQQRKAVDRPLPLTDTLPMPGLTVYSYAKCQTCQKAIKWLEARRIPHSVVPIREQPPKQAEIKAMLKHVDGDVGRLFNRSGQDYRTLGLSAKLDGMSEIEAIKLLAGNGNLVKRPFVLTTRVGLVGFDATTWAKALG